MWKKSILAMLLLTFAASCQPPGTTGGPNAQQKALKKVYDDAATVRNNILGEARARLEAIKEEVARKGPSPETTSEIARLEKTIQNSERLNEEAQREFESEYQRLATPDK